MPCSVEIERQRKKKYPHAMYFEAGGVTLTLRYRKPGNYLVDVPTNRDLIMADRPAYFYDGGLDTSPEAIQALPSLEELGVPQEILEAAGELFSDADASGVEEYRLSTLVRLIVFHLRNV